MITKRLIAIAIATLTAMAIAVPAAIAFQTHAGTFTDDDGFTHEANTEAIFDDNLTDGCNPPDNDEFCPLDEVTRGQMAKFLDRAAEFPSTDTDYFTDDEDSTFEAHINDLREAGITDGCNPPENDEYCPERLLNRGEMAKFLARTFELPETENDHFTDDEDSQFEADINRVAEAGITFGCNPPENDEYCPDRTVTRGEMSSFLARAKGLSHPDPTPFGNKTCDAAYFPCVPTVEEMGDLACDDITEHYPDGVQNDFENFGDPHDINQDEDDMACETGDPALVT